MGQEQKAGDAGLQHVSQPNPESGIDDTVILWQVQLGSRPPISLGEGGEESERVCVYGGELCFGAQVLGEGSCPSVSCTEFGGRRLHPVRGATSLVGLCEDNVSSYLCESAETGVRSAVPGPWCLPEGPQ